MAGRAISIIVPSIEVIKVPRVVLERATHLYSTVEFAPLVQSARLSIVIGLSIFSNYFT